MESFCKNIPTPGSLRTYFLLFIILGSFYLTYAEKDFEFSETLVDDEELQNDEAGSGRELDGEGSGAVEHGTAPGYPEYYRVTLNFTDLIYTSHLADRNSREFQQLAQELADHIELLFAGLEGSQLATVLRFSPGSLLVTLDLGTQGLYDKDKLLAVLNKAIAEGKIGPHKVSPLGFSFKGLTEAIMCPTEVGRAPSKLPKIGNNFANLLINNAFPCAGKVIAWEYYRIVPRWSGYVGVWRQISELDFVLIGKTELPVAEEGFHIVNVDPPIHVQKGDFIGIFYPRNVEEGVVASADHTTAEVPQNELFENYYTQLYNDDIDDHVPVSLNNFQYNVARSTFAIHAHMDYVGIDVDAIPAPLPCTRDEFNCYDGECVDINYRCDGQLDCYDGSDEQNCAEMKCAPDEFRCQDRIQCIHKAFFCDGAIDCQDGSDESNCPFSGTLDSGSCRPDQFKCVDGTCVEAERRCDSRVDCPDSTDEYNCAECDGFHCQNGQCIDLINECDKFPDCDDGSDESDCPLCSNPSDFQCADGTRCIPHLSRCNNVKDCADGSDEDGCPKGLRCQVGEFSCVSGTQCIPLNQRCDEEIQCDDRSDEAGCTSTTTCPEGLFHCDNDDCIDITRNQRCDGYKHCDDGSDEFPKYCNCSASERMCADGKECVNALRWCNGNVDCRDGSDELKCACESNEYRCVDGTCIDERRKCDGHFDCPDKTDETDEADCPVYCPEGLHQCENKKCVEISIDQLCDGIWHCEDGSDEYPERCGCTNRLTEMKCSDGKQCVGNHLKCDGNVDCKDGSDEHDCPLRCRSDEYMCASQTQCVNRRVKCDDYEDCLDGSDEQGCACDSNEYRCIDGTCIDERRKCDGHFDCPDRTDEADCPLRCTSEQFMCASQTECVSSSVKCDGYEDCLDGSDEQDCVCRDDEYRCEADNHCILLSSLCNRVRDCSDGADEIGCPCHDDEFECLSGVCIPASQRCDQRQDCPDGSDEQSCPCRDDQFTCGDGHCVSSRSRCDQRRDCEDGSDEANCPCRDNEFTCGDGLCIPANRHCDRRPDCEDGTDELNCGCSAEEHECDGRCIDLRHVCDGRLDCQDGTDEEECAPKQCTSDEFQCRSDRKCIDRRRYCDSRQDCDDGSDEEDCPTRECELHQFTCISDGRCIEQASVCDDRFDCADRSDESDCQPRCRAEEFQCESGRCVHSASRCNGRVECEDGSDERNCPRPIIVTVTPKIMTVREGREVVFECQATGSPPPTVRWSRLDQGLPLQASEVSGRLTIPVSQVEDSGNYVCSALGVSGDYRDVAQLTVVRMGPDPSEPPSGPCGRDEAVCQNGQCIPSDYRCDGEDDCSDGSDEFNCSDTSPCEPNEMRCDGGRCVMKIWRCDGDNDCGDNSDERDCATNRPGTACRAIEYQCLSGDQCVPAAYQCDGEIDCQDRSDEIGCAPPTIIVPPVPNIEVEVGGVFTVICEAVGVPTPLIVWRLNWGNIPTGDRVTVVSEGGKGRLTIRDAIAEDSGAYTCEAINNKGSIFAIPDAIVIVRRQSGVCQPPLYNVAAGHRTECVPCFCFDHTSQCYSSGLHVTRITLANNMELVNRQTMQPVQQLYIDFYPNTKEHVVTDFHRVLPSGSYYWNLPREFTGYQLPSYGGDLKYTIFYEIAAAPSQTDEPDVIVMGNGITLYYRGEDILRPGRSTTLTIPLVENAWEKTEGPRRGDTPISEYASKSDLMMALENVTSIWIRASYDVSQTLTRIGDISMSTAVSTETGGGQAVLVEDCTCPTGYQGLSCQDCAPGFYRQTGDFLGVCRPCNCHGHSNDCDPASGICRSCQHHTMGFQCEVCVEGYVGVATRGTPTDCQPCPCPLTRPSNQFSPTCNMDQLGQIICTACPRGYEGRQCERCAEGYVGNPNTPGDSCRKTTVEEFCDSRGSLYRQPDPVTGQCQCKENVEGITCDRCASNTFFISEANSYGCLPCFCMGLTRSCTSTSWNRVQVAASFTRDSLGFKLADMIQEQVITEGFRVNPSVRELIYSNFNNLPRDTYYWSLPRRFLGDKITAYGGSLRFVLQYRPGIDSSPYQPSAPLVEITGNDFTLAYRHTDTVRPNSPVSFNVKFTEANWMRVPDGEQVTREVLLMALADLDSILIRATFSATTDESSIRDVTLDVAEDRRTGQDRALAVEQCACPRGYSGLSCEDCDVGYTRSGTGLYLGLCVPCDCNGHSSECDAETGVCRNCQHNTEGDHCERCSVGYYGDVNRGSRTDCQPCPCPLTTAPNQFSPTCILDTDRQVTCTACPAGHTGRRCQNCIAGYSGDPSRRGDYCKIPEIPCECDNRGTIPNAQCDPQTEQCPCKPFVHGLRCARCQEGYFHLHQDNAQGCLACFCMGITNKCQSSSYYRDRVRPQFHSDGTHNFVLTSRRLNNMVQDGFVVDASRDQITFTQFEGIQVERESLFFNLPPKFRGDKVSSYGGVLRFTLEYNSRDGGRQYRDVDIEVVSRGQNLRMYHLFNQQIDESQPTNIEIPIVESSFILASGGDHPSREIFLTILADIEAILIRATYNQQMRTATLRDLSLDVAVPTPTGLGEALDVESCRCPDGYTGLSCQTCAAGYLRVQDTGTAIGRCVRCSCNGHATSCDPETGKCLSCQDNTEGDRCERCLHGYYGDATVGTTNDCRPCPCPLTIPSNQFARTCYLATDNQVTCERCESGYTGRDCGTCERDYYGNPRQAGGTCKERTEEYRPVVTVTPISIEEPIGSSVSIQCSATGQGPFNIVWSRLDARPLPNRARTGPQYTLTIQDLIQTDTGRYVCTATNVYGTSRSYVDIQVVGRQQPIRVRIEEPTQVTVDEGGTARFVCSATGSGREATILSWERRDRHLPPRAIDQNGVLVIPNVQREDAGTYICTGSDMYSVDTSTAILIVGSSEEAPQVRIEPRYLQINEGDPVEFHCIATGSPTPTLEWQRKDSQPLSARASFENGYFRIPAATHYDQAEYFCRATNAAGTSEIRTILYVERGPQPPDVTVIVRQTTIIAIVGTTATLECYVEDGTGQVTLVWSRQGAGLPPGSRQLDGTLTIPNVQSSYSGNYICQGTTPTGISGTATTTLSITPDIAREAPTAVIEPQRHTFAMGTTGTLRCSITGKPQPTVTWSRARGELSSNHQVNGEMLRIIQTSMDDRGVYVCRAENAAGSAQGWAIVEIERRMMPKIDLHPSSTQTISIGQSALFQCRVMDGDPPPSISWARAGGEAFTSTTDVMENGVLMFHAVTGEEMGGYVCSATNDLGTISETATLIIQGPPTITIQPSKVIYAIVGERVTVECIGEGDPSPSVYWRDDRRPQRGDIEPELSEADIAREQTAHLVFNSISKGDARSYVCVAQNEAGSTEETVTIRVDDRSSGEDVGVSISGPGTLSVVEGQNVDLTCSSRGLINPAIRWRRREGILPPNHQVRNGNLYIPRFQSQYQGEYICSARAAQGNYESSVIIIVTVSPQLTVSPQRVAARAGDRITLNCQGSGSGPFQIEWRKMSGVLSASATQSDGRLSIHPVTAADAGEYRCTVTNSAGSNEGYALVEVQVPPTVAVSDKDVTGRVGDRLELRCQVSGSPKPTIRWQKESGHLPIQHNIQDGVLTIYRLEQQDAGRYICTAESEVGSSRDFTYVDVQSGGPDINTDVRVDTQTVDVGDRVEMECIVRGTPRPTVTWSRVGDRLPASAVIGDELLIIPDAREEDAGVYVCTAVNVAGSVSSRVILQIRARPIISRQNDMHTAALGGSMTLSCDAHGYPQPDVNWHRREGDLPRDHSVKDGSLEIHRVRAEDAGTYICSAENQFGYDEQPVELVVGDLVPYFPQNPVSYMSYPPLHDAYLDFDIELNLRPETLDGMVLYNGQYETGHGDFVCFGLQGGYPEFRYDVGSGPAIIRGNHSLQLNEWHKVRLSRNRKEGSMIVNDQPTYTGMSPGRFQGLDLLENMYIGAVPDFDRIPRATGARTGFVGSISEVQLKGVELNLGEDALEIQGIEPFNSCYNQPCQDWGTCIPANNHQGYKCVCAQGFTGPYCEKTGERCYQGACGHGRCFDLPERNGYQCICPFGKTGKSCQNDLTFSIPSFNKTSFISYSTIEDGLMQLSIHLDIKLASLDDGIIMYDAGSEDGTGDFVALVVKDHYLEFRFDTGSGPAVVRSRHTLPQGEWIRVVAERRGREGSLTINDEEAVKVRQWNFHNNYYNRYYYRYRRYRRATAPGRTVGLNLRLPLFLGGVDPHMTVSSGVGVTQGFVGCIAQLEVNGRDVDLVTQAKESSNVVDCGQRQPCDRNPCRNGGYCRELTSSTYMCNCPNEFTGKNCEIEVNLCVTRQPCQNGAPCSIRSDGNYKCDCPLGFFGSECEARIELGTRLEMAGDGYVEFDKELLPHANGQEHEVVSFTISTTEPNGLIFWQGKDEGSPIRGGDYLAIAVRDGYVELGYELGSGPAMIRSNRRVNDGYQYKVIASRLGRTGTLIISGVNGNKMTDDSEQVQGESAGILQMLNVEGNIYIGGVPNLQQMTDGKFSHNFIGCITDIIIHEHGPMTVPENAVAGFNVRPCVN